MFKEMIEKTKDGMKRLSHPDHTTTAAPQKPMQTFRHMGHDKVVDIANQFHSSLPIFEKAGFKLQNLEIEVGISPKIIPHFMIIDQPSEEEKKQAIKEIKSNRLMKPVMDALIKASYLHRYIKIGDLPFIGIEVHFAIVPTVRLIFGKHRYSVAAPALPIPDAPPQNQPGQIMQDP